MDIPNKLTITKKIAVRQLVSLIAEWRLLGLKADNEEFLKNMEKILEEVYNYKMESELEEIIQGTDFFQLNWVSGRWMCWTKETVPGRAGIGNTACEAIKNLKEKNQG